MVKRACAEVDVARMNSLLTKAVWAFALCAASLTLSACGGSDSPSEANVNGTWTIAASGEAPKTTWKVTPTCSSGPCDFKADMGLGQKVTFTLSSGEYVNENSATEACVGEKGSVTVSTRSVFKPTAVEGDNVTAADVTATTSVKGGCDTGGAIPSVTQKATRSSGS